MDMTNHQLEFLRADVHYNTYDWRVRDIVYNIHHLIRNKEGTFLSDLDTNIAWSLKQMSEYIESILLGMPQMPITLGKIVDESDGGATKYLVLDGGEPKYLVLDGWCRLQALTWFIHYNGVLHGLSMLTNFNGKTYYDLLDTPQECLLNACRRIIVISDDSPKWVYERMLKNKG